MFETLMNIWKNLMKIKPVVAYDRSDGHAQTESSHPSTHTLQRTLTAPHLITLGIGAVIGAGIFVITGQAAAEHAGPAVTLSFIIAAIACTFAGLCYAEFAAMLPVSGSAYSYAYATLGESVAWLIGWCLIMEYLFSTSSVAVAWSAYVVSFLYTTTGITLPDYLVDAPIKFVNNQYILTGAWFNLPAILIILGISALCYKGLRQSTLINGLIVAIKIGVICLLVGFGFKHIATQNWSPFIPENTGVWGNFGVSGIFRAASKVFFAYIGFDAVSTAAGETRNPQRNLPIGILGTLGICTLIYIIVSAVLTGLAPYSLLDTARPVATAIGLHPSLKWLEIAVEIGAVAGLSSVILVMQTGLSRIVYTIAGDGLFPQSLAAVHPRYHTPHRSIIVVGMIAALLAGFIPLNVLGEMVSMGATIAFATVCIGVMVLRSTKPDLKRPFSVPYYKIICPLGAFLCFMLFYMAFKDNKITFLTCFAIGICIYIGYGIRHSRLAQAT